MRVQPDPRPLLGIVRIGGNRNIQMHESTTPWSFSISPPAGRRTRFSPPSTPFLHLHTLYPALAVRPRRKSLLEESANQADATLSKQHSVNHIKLSYIFPAQMDLEHVPHS